VCAASEAALAPREGCERHEVLAHPAVAPAVKVRHRCEPGCWLAREPCVVGVRVGVLGGAGDVR